MTSDVIPDGFVPALKLAIRALDTLKIMADPLRMQLIDLMRRDAATVKELAASLRVSPKSLYYHVNLLEKHGLIRVVDTRMVSGILERRYRTTAYVFDFSDMVPGPETPPAVAQLEAISSLFAITRDDIRIGLEAGLIDPAPEKSPASLAMEWGILYLSAVERDAFDQRVLALIEEYTFEEPTSEDQQPYRLLLTMFPTYRRGERPDLPSQNLETRGEQ